MSGGSRIAYLLLAQSHATSLITKNTDYYDYSLSLAELYNVTGLTPGGEIHNPSRRLFSFFFIHTRDILAFFW